jgi:hypothetical protein
MGNRDVGVMDRKAEDGSGLDGIPGNPVGIVVYI